jgi:hypothetical protein
MTEKEKERDKEKEKEKDKDKDVKAVPVASTVKAYRYSTEIRSVFMCPA